MRQRSSGGNFFAFLTGAAVGAASALLLAPQSGRQTRDKITGYVQRGQQKSHQFQDAVYAASEAARQAFLQALNEEVGPVQQPLRTGTVPLADSPLTRSS